MGRMPSVQIKCFILKASQGNVKNVNTDKRSKPFVLECTSIVYCEMLNETVNIF